MSDPDTWLAVRGSWSRASWLPVKNNLSADAARAVLVDALARGAVIVECSEPSRWFTSCDEWALLSMTDSVRATLAVEAAERERKLKCERLAEQARQAHRSAVLEGMRVKAQREEERRAMSDLDGYWTNTESPDPTREVAARVIISKVVEEAMRLDQRSRLLGRPPLYIKALSAVALGDANYMEKSRARSLASKFITSERLRMEFA